MSRFIRLFVLLAIGALVALLVIKMRASRTSEATVDGVGSISGSFDTWPDVPVKQSA